MYLPEDNLKGRFPRSSHPVFPKKEWIQSHINVLFYLIFYVLPGPAVLTYIDIQEATNNLQSSPIHLLCYNYTNEDSPDGVLWFDSNHSV